MREPLDRLFAALGPPRDAGVSDADLLARAADGGDRVALELVVRRHAGLVWRVCLAVGRDREAAEDAFQAAFLALARDPAAVRGRSAAGWLHRVAYRAARHARKRPPSGPVVDRPSGDAGPAEAAERAELAAAAYEALNGLPDKYRVPVVLCHLEGYTQAEAAQQLGLPLGTVAVRVRRGLDRLRTRLTGSPLAAGAAVAGKLGAAPGPVVYRACQLASGATTPPPAVAALAAAAVARSGAKLVALVAALVGVASVGVAAAGFAGRPPAVAVAQPPAPVVPQPVREPDPVFLAYPVTTDLQRVLVSEEAEVGTVVLVSRAAAARGDEAADPESPALAPLREALAGGGFRTDRPVLFSCPRPDPAAPRDPRPDVAAEPLNRLGRAAGFAGVLFTHAPGTLADDWPAAVAAARSFRPTANGEAAVTAGRFAAYPVRTPLSRLLAGGADCVVVPTAAQPPDGDENGLSAARAAVDALRLPARETVLVLTSRRRGDARQVRLTPEQAGESLGFRRAVVRPGPEVPKGRTRGPHPPGGR